LWCVWDARPERPWWTRNGVSWSLPLTRLPPNSLRSAVTTSYQVTVCNGSACRPSRRYCNRPGTGCTGGTGSTGHWAAPSAGPRSGYSRTMFYNWNWASGAFTVDTYNSSQGPIGPTVSSSSSSRQLRTGSHWERNLPDIPVTSTGRTVRFRSTTAPCDFSQPFPWTRYGYDYRHSVLNCRHPSCEDLRPWWREPVLSEHREARNEAGASTCQPQERLRYAIRRRALSRFRPTRY
jgi:hypothetical protein